MWHVAEEMILLSNVFKISHYQQKLEKRILEIKQIEPATAFSNFEQEKSDEEMDQESLRAIQQARQIIEEAHIQAAHIKEDAMQEMERWRAEQLQRIDEEREKLFQNTKEQAFQVGYNEGFELGISEGRQKYEQHIAEAQSLILQAETEWKKRVLQSEPYMIELVIEVAKKIIQRELMLDHTTIVGMVQEALKQSSELKEITVALHPSDYDTVRQYLDELKRHISNQANIILVPDHSITSGGCMIRSSLGTLDARIDTQLEEVKKALMDVIEGCELHELESATEI